MVTIFVGAHNQHVPLDLTLPIQVVKPTIGYASWIDHYIR